MQLAMPPHHHAKRKTQVLTMSAQTGHANAKTATFGLAKTMHGSKQKSAVKVKHAAMPYWIVSRINPPPSAQTVSLNVIQTAAVFYTVSVAHGQFRKAAAVRRAAIP